MEINIIDTIKLNEILAHKNSNDLLIDVRFLGEYNSGKIPGAINIPLGEISSKAEELKNSGKNIYLYCHSGGRSEEACRRLHLLEVPNLFQVEGGIQDWEDNGFEIEK